MPNETTYVCCDCNEAIVDRVYLVQRRRVRPIKETLPDGTVQHNMADIFEPFHAGIRVGPEKDPYCSLCYAKLPIIQELIDDYKSGLDSASKNLD